MQEIVEGSYLKKLKASKTICVYKIQEDIK
jgi:hypothetical protein